MHVKMFIYPKITVQRFKNMQQTSVISFLQIQNIQSSELIGINLCILHITKSSLPFKS